MRTRSIANKLLFWFLILAIVPIILFSYLNYQTASGAIIAGIRSRLIALADNKTQAIEVVISNVHADVSALSQLPLMIEAINQLQSNPRSSAYAEFFGALLENFHYHEIILASAQGKILFSKGGLAALAPQSELFRVFERAITLVELNTSNFEPVRDELTAYVAVPILNDQKAIVGVFIVGFSNEAILPIIANYAGLGRTGETLLAAEQDRKYQLITPVRTGDPPAPEQIAQIASIQQAVNGTSGSGKGIDYRQKEVIEAWQYVPSLNAGLVVKIDTLEALTAVRELRNSTIVIALGSSLLVILIALGVARSISQPIIDLTAVTKSIMSGEFLWEAPIASNDEIGELARSFNLMMNRLHNSFQELETVNQELEERVRERTMSLQWANTEINLLNEKLKEDNIRMSSELEITRRLQKMILPKAEELVGIPNLDIAGFMQPATEVGGDYYDVIQNNGGVHIGVGDITGHGLESGILMIMLQTAVRTLAHANIKSPMSYINILNQVIYENINRMEADKSLTLMLMEYTHATNHLRITGQHEDAIVVRNDGTVQCIDTIDLGFPIGIESDITAFIGQVTIQLSTGDVVVLYTDGITEAENPHKKFYGKERLCEVIRHNLHYPAEQIRELIISDLLTHIGSQIVFDDITLVVIKKK